MESSNSTIDKCELIDFPVVLDARGALTFIEQERHVPFDLKRVYYLYDVPSGATRAAHAHKNLQQVYICLSGSMDVHLDDGENKKTIHLNRPHYGLYLCPGIWRYIDNFSSNSVLMVLTNELYDEQDYIRDYDEYLRFRGLS